MERIVTVLVVSSREEDHDFFVKFFRQTNWRLYQARSCQEAMDALTGLPIAVVITDGDLPDGGWEQVYRAAAGRRLAPNVIATFRSTEEEEGAARMLAAGVHDLLGKPFRQKEVSQAIVFAWLQWLGRAESLYAEMRPSRTAYAVSSAME